MNLLIKIILRTSLTIVILFVLWLVALFAQLPVIPWRETHYYIAGSDRMLDSGYILKQTENAIIIIEVPDEFPEKDQCFDFWFSSAKGTHILTVKDFSQAMFDRNNSEIKRVESYLFTHEGGQENKFEIHNYKIVYADNYDEKRYAFFRTVFDVSDIKNFSLKLKTKFSIDDQPYSIDTTLSIEKKHKLTWNKFRVH